MPKLNGNFTLRQISNIIPYFRPDTKMDISFQSSYPGYSSASWKNWKDFKFSARIQLYFPIDLCKRVCFKKYASLLTMVWYIKNSQKTIFFWHPTNPYSWCNRSPSLFGPGGHYLLPFNRTTVNLSDLVLLFRGGLLDQIFGYNFVIINLKKKKTWKILFKVPWRSKKNCFTFYYNFKTTYGPVAFINSGNWIPHKLQTQRWNWNCQHHMFS